MSAEPTSASATSWIGPVIASTVALGIALTGFYRDRIQRWLRSRPLEINAGRAEPLYQRTSILPLKFVVRLLVRSHSGMPEKGISVLIADHLIDGARLHGFVPIRLKWTHRDTPVLDNLAPGQCAFVDLGVIGAESHGVTAPFTMQLATEVAPENGVSVLQPDVMHRLAIHAVTEDGLRSKVWIEFRFRRTTLAASVTGSAEMDAGLEISVR